MSMVSLPSAKKSPSALRWPAMAAGMLAAWLTAGAVLAAHAPGYLERATAEQRDLLHVPEKSWLSDANVSRRAQAAVADRAGGVPATGDYFRALTRIYGASTDDHQPMHAEQLDQRAQEPLPRDEVASFHEMETHAPVVLARISSAFGHRRHPLGKGRTFHRGIDLAAPAGTPVHAVAAGTVIRSASDRSYGNVVVINHHNGYKTLYAHNATLLVKVGQQVKAGQQIAKVGSTGHSTGPHLHFEIHRSGQRVDPAPYLAAL
jgi:murein DD-endopeptidase MepM/ murein hydrolase activator NlpD